MVQTDGQNQENSAICIMDGEHDATECRGNREDKNYTNPNDAECTQE